MTACEIVGFNNSNGICFCRSQFYYIVACQKDDSIAFSWLVLQNSNSKVSTQSLSALGFALYSLLSVIWVLFLGLWGPAKRQG